MRIWSSSAPHGIGKTTLFKNSCHQAVVAGHAVLFTTASKLIGDVTGTDSPSVLDRRLKHYCRMTVLAIDELGYLSYDQRAADLLFEFVSRRYEAGKPVLISTNLAFREWGSVFPDATCTVALVVCGDEDAFCSGARCVRPAHAQGRRPQARRRLVAPKGVRERAQRQGSA